VAAPSAPPGAPGGIIPGIAPLAGPLGIPPAGGAPPLVGAALATCVEESPPPQPAVETINNAATHQVRNTAFEAFDIIHS
jgi:hypothetical protein